MVEPVCGCRVAPPGHPFFVGWSKWISMALFFFFSSRRRHTRCSRDWSSDVCSSDLASMPRDCSASNTLRPESNDTSRSLELPPSSTATRPNTAGSVTRSGGKVSVLRSEERRVGEEGRYRWAPDHLKKKQGKKALVRE